MPLGGQVCLIILLTDERFAEELACTYSIYLTDSVYVTFGIAEKVIFISHCMTMIRTASVIKRQSLALLWFTSELYVCRCQNIFVE